MGSDAQTDTSSLVGEVDHRRPAGDDRVGESRDTTPNGPASSLSLLRKDGGKRSRVRLITTAIASTIAVACLALIITAVWWVDSLGPAPLGRDLAYSAQVVDRNGKLLRAFATPAGRWRFPVEPKDVDQRFFDLLFAYEDRRFYDHSGVDPWALGRAALQFIAAGGHIVSGGSTLTMQVARLLEPREQRSFKAKLKQIVRAIEIERHLSKDAVLALYLRLAPYGGNLEGIRAATLAYFGKEPRRLTLGEAALLVALPQSPEARRPDRFPQFAKDARDRVLERAAAAGVITAAQVARAKAESVPHARRPMLMLAPHMADRVMAEAPDQSIHRLTIEAGLQASLEELARERARGLGPDVSVAIIAIDHATGEVLARVGSADYFDDRRAGQVDMTVALRSPGSALKPFIYGLGFEDGLIHPETLIDDRPVRYGGYAPENFDSTYQGTVPVRRALQLSLNVPAIMVLDKVGPMRLAARLAQAGGHLVLPPGEAPGLAIGLGGAGITLADLVRLYAGLARLGTTVAIAERRDAGYGGQPQRLMEPVAAWQVGNVLRGAPPPDNAVGGRIAFKTGTSYGYRDAWAIGFDGAHTIGVWVGRPDGAPVPGILGRISAAPILFDAFARIGPTAEFPSAPRGVLLASNSKLPRPLQRFGPNGLTNENAGPPLRIMFPPNGASLELGSGGDGFAAIPLKVMGGRQPLTVLVNGTPRATQRSHHAYAITPDGIGFVRLTVMDAAGQTDSVLVRLQ